MRLAVYGAVLVIALGSVLLGLDRLPAPMSPMVDTAAGLAAAPAPALQPPPRNLRLQSPVRRLARLLFHRRLPRLQVLPLPQRRELQHKRPHR